MSIIHLLIFAAFGLTMYSSLSQFGLYFLFSPVFFYVTAILHIVFSVRAVDYRLALKWSR